MESVVLVDSCVFIDLLREGKDPAVELLGRVPSTDLATCGMVRLEVVRGVAHPKLRQAIEGFFDVMQNVPTDPRLWEETARLAWALDRAGHVLPAQDILIASCARRISAPVLTFDRHFDLIPGLRVLHSLGELE